MTSQLYPSALQPGYRLHEYEIVSVLGVGGFGITYLATDTRLAMLVAIKEYLPNSLAVRIEGSTVMPKSQTDADDFHWGLERFLQEAQTLARFRHPSIVRVLRFFEANGTGYTVMEYEKGQSLGQYLAANPPAMDEATLRGLLLPLLDGLRLVHAAGFLHRDIKPANIYLRADGTPVLIDFGSARQAMGSHTQNLTSVFTPGYAPFEQYFADGRQGPWTDIYALAAVAYRLVAGMPPPEAARRVTEDTLLPATTLCRGRYSAALLNAIDQGLQLNETARPQDIDAWLAQLNAAPATSAAPATAGTQTPAITHTDADAPTVAVRPNGKRPTMKKSPAWQTTAIIVLALLAVVTIAGHLKQRSIQTSTASNPDGSFVVPDTPMIAAPAHDTPAEVPTVTSAAQQPTPAPALVGHETPERRFDDADSNGDGYLSRDEAALAFPRMARVFERVDQNHDGLLSRREFDRAIVVQRRRELQRQR